MSTIRKIHSIGGTNFTTKQTIVLVSSTQVDPVPPTVAGQCGRRACQSDRRRGGRPVRHRSNRTVPVDGWNDDAEEDDRMSEADVGFVGGAEEFEEEDVPFQLPGMAT